MPAHGAESDGFSRVVWTPAGVRPGAPLRHSPMVMYRSRAAPKRKGPLTKPERPKSREETPKEGSGTAASNAAPH
jgi:hypothetical protein